MFILPVNDDGYIGRRAYVFLCLVALNAFVLVATYIHPSHAEALFQQYGFVPTHPHFSTLLASIFLHAGFWHFAGNMFFLWMFAPRVENTFGRFLFAAMYIVSGCGAGVLHFAFNRAATIPARRSGKRCSRRGTSFCSREHVDKFEEHWYRASEFNFHFLGTRIRGYDAVQFRTCGRGANKNHARAAKRMCAHGTCGKRWQARIDPKMKQTTAEPMRGESGHRSPSYSSACSSLGSQCRLHTVRERNLGVAILSPESMP